MCLIGAMCLVLGFGLVTAHLAIKCTQFFGVLCHAAHFLLFRTLEVPLLLLKSPGDEKNLKINAM